MDRRSVILERAQKQGRVTVDALADELGVSTHTVRRDLNALCEETKLRRLHGGAEYIDGSINLPYPHRSVLNHKAKAQIASHVGSLIPDGATVFVSIGTTPALVAQALARKDALTVITNNLNAAMALAENASNRIILPGGELRLPDRDLLNEAAIDMFASYRADFGIYGVAGIDADGSLLDFHSEEIEAREQIRLNSQTSVLVADSSKFGRRAVAAGGWLQDADIIALDKVPEAPFDMLVNEVKDRVLPRERVGTSL